MFTKKRVAIVDYGVGNLFSLASSIRKVDYQACLCRTPEELLGQTHIILPGVGAFEDAAQKLCETGLDEALHTAKKNGACILGICLGMQLLFEKSFENGQHKGLSLLQGEVVPMQGVIDESLKIPHIGWNALHFSEEGSRSPLFFGIEEGNYVYFVHSYYAQGCENSLLATTEYGAPLTAACGHKNIFGTQFHPEKSGVVGLRILKNFCSLGLPTIE